jgi:signal recognition particle GTPase
MFQELGKDIDVLMHVLNVITWQLSAWYNWQQMNQSNFMIKFCASNHQDTQLRDLKRSQELHIIRTLFSSGINIQISSSRYRYLQTEKHKAHKPVQHEELKFEEFINWSFQSYEDGFSSEEDNPEERVARWIVKKKKKHLLIENLDQQIVKDLIINTKQQERAKQSEGRCHSTKTFIEEAFRSIMTLVTIGLNNCSGISDPSNSRVSF